jgi:DNA-binding Xre family transcriptional regulator
MINISTMKLNILKLQRILDEKNVNQSWLAKEMGISRQAVNNWFQNPEAIRLTTIAKIATAVDEDPKELIAY